MRKLTTGNFLVAIFLMLILGAAFFLAGGLPSTSPNNPFIPTATPQSVLIAPTDAGGGDSLRIGTIPTILPTPTTPPTPIPQPTHIAVQPTAPPQSGNTCAHNAPKTDSCVCSAESNLVSICPGGSQPQDCTNRGGFPVGSKCGYSIGTHSEPGCEDVCWGKPVIYLYPKKPTLVSVKLDIPGVVTVSDPSYPTSGWENILANPDGRLKYQDKTYRELFYETSVTQKPTLTNESTYSSSDLQEILTHITYQLGLQPVEQKEFLDYWLPRLAALHSPYISISLLSPEEKEKTDHVVITPKPDTFIGFLLYFQPKSLPEFSNHPLVLPNNPPSRIGFTAVEWGGTIVRQ